MSAVSEEIQDTVRFFALLFKSHEQEIRQLVSEEKQDLQLTGKNVFTLQETFESVDSLETGIKRSIQEHGEKVSKLVGSLCMQLVGQASSQNATIAPKASALEDEQIIKLFKHGINQQQQNMNKISDKTLLNNEQKILELQSDLKKRDDEIRKLNELLQNKVDQAPQFVNLKKILQDKEKEIEQLQEQLEKK